MQDASSALAPLQGDLAAPHGFFTRQGGVSTGLYASLNCGFGAEADSAENVTRNRARAATALGVAPKRLVTAYQIHSPDVVAVTEPFSRDDAPKADALTTRAPGLALGVLSADCAPVLFEEVEAGVVGAAHAGWRGAFGGVLEATVEAMVQLGAKRERIRAAIGPCIGPSAYEVGPEFVERFVTADAASARFFHSAATEAARAAGKARFDLPTFALARLEAAGVTQAAWIGRCTYEDETRFFSNRRAVRRQEGDYGRLLSAIALPQ